VGLHVGEETAVLAPMAAGDGPLLLVDALVAAVFSVEPETNRHEVPQVFSGPPFGTRGPCWVHELSTPRPHVAHSTRDVFRVFSHHGVVVLGSVQPGVAVATSIWENILRFLGKALEVGSSLLESNLLPVIRPE